MPSLEPMTRVLLPNFPSQDFNLDKFSGDKAETGRPGRGESKKSSLLHHLSTHGRERFNFAAIVALFICAI